MLMRGVYTVLRKAGLTFPPRSFIITLRELLVVGHPARVLEQGFWEQVCRLVRVGINLTKYEDLEKLVHKKVY